MEHIYQILNQNLEKIKEIDPSFDKYINYSLGVTMRDLRYFQKISQKREVKITDINTIPIDIPNVLIRSFKAKNNHYHYQDKTGLIEVKLSNKKRCYFLKVYDFYQKEVHSIGISDEETWKLMIDLHRRTFDNLDKPKKGIFRAYRNVYDDIDYLTIKQNTLPKNQLVHPVYGEIIKDINVFFNSEHSLYIEFNKPIVRKVMFVGKYGTGKSSMSYDIGKTFSKTHNITFLMDMKMLMRHLDKICIYKTPSIVIFEDCETHLKDANSEVLNFLDGIDQPFIKKGAYVIFVTNYPELIPARIRSRQGRIDRLFHFGKLRNEHALQCARMYFGKHLELKPEDSAIFDNMTGGEIFGLVNSVFSFASGKQQRPSIEMIKEMKKSVMIDYERMYQYQEEEMKKKQRQIGFRNSDDESPF